MKKQIKQLSKKSLSVLLAVIMIMTSMSVCFGTISFAADTNATDAQWSALASALQTDAVKNANFTGNKYNKTVTDPNGDLIAAVDAWWTVFNAIKENVGNDSQSNAYRTAPQVNAAIAAKLSGSMGTAYTTYNVASFLSGVIAGVAESDIQSAAAASAENKTANNINNNNNQVLKAASTITLTVNLAGVLSYDSVEELPDGDMATTKTFTIKHRNSNYYQTSAEKTEDCDEVTYYTRHYYYVISSTDAANGNYQNTSVLKQSKATLDANLTYLSASLGKMVGYINNDAAAAKAAHDAINTAKTNVDNFNPNAWAKYFSAYDLVTFNSNYALAGEIVRVGNVALNLYNLKEAGYDSIITDETALKNLHSQLTEGLKTFNDASQAAKDYIVNYDYNGVKFNPADIQAFADEVLVEIQVIALRKLKADIDSTIPAYYDYNEDKVIAGTVIGETLVLAKGTVDGYVSSIGTYTAAVIERVGMTDYKAGLQALSADLEYLIKTANYDDQFSAKYAKYISEIYDATDITKASADLVAALKGNADEGIESYDAWYTGLKNLIATIEANLEPGTADKIMTTLDDAMKAHMDSIYDTLHGRVLAQIDNATELYAVISALNGKIDVLNVTNYSVYKHAFENLDRDTYNYLKDEANNFTMPQETINKFNALNGDFTILENFLATGGFSSFSQIFGEYVNREVLANDILRDEEFVVDKAKIENVIASLDKLITSEEVGSLLGGLLGAAEGEAFNLGTMLTDTIKDMLFTDDFINTVVGALYPIIAEGLVGVWHKDIPNMASGTDIAGMLNKNLYQIADGVGLALFPATVAKTLDSTKYADNIAKLNAADAEFRAAYPDNADDRYVQETIKAEDGTVAEVKVIATPWKSSVLYDESGEKMILTWGVDAARKQYEDGEITQAEFETVFYEAFDDAFDGIRALFRALIGDTKFTGNSVEVLNVWVAGANLSLNANGNAGYTNLLVPIYEALGAKVEGTEGATFTYEAPATIKGYASKSNSTALLLKAILAPIFSFLGEIGKAPLATLIEALPNLCYALSMQMVSPLLGMLKTSLEINIELWGLASALGGCDRLPIDLSKPILYDLAVGGPDGLLKLDDVVDLSNGINSLLGMLGLPLPEIDQGKVAQMGEKVTIPTSRTEYIYSGLEGTGTAYHIAADKGAVGNYLLNYIFGILEDEEAFKGLLGMLMTVKDENGNPVKDANGKNIPDTAKIEETLASFDEMGLFKYGKNNAIAAIVELFNQEENFAFGDYVWYEGAIYEGSTVTNLTPAMVAYLSYNSSLTREKAEYIVENIEAIIGAVMKMINGDEESTFSIATMLGDLIGGLFSNETITTLAKKLSALDLNALLAGAGNAEEETDEPETVAEGDEPEAGGSDEAEAAPAIDITALIKDLLGIDLGAFAAYADLADDTDWGVTDAATFAAALAEVLAPFAPVIDFIFKGEDLKVIYDDAQPSITIKGYDGYDTAIVPLLEALGVDAPAMGEDDDALVVILNAVLGLLETVIGTDEEGKPVDAVAGILNILPGLLYFIQSNGLTTAVNNLLHPVYQLLDTIRPIYELDLMELLGTLLEDTGITLDLNNLNFDFVLGLVKNLVGLDLTDLGVLIADVCKVAVVDYTSESSLIGENGKKGAYTEFFDGTDLVAVIINFALDWARNQNNVDALAAVIGGEDAELTAQVKEYIAGAYALIAGIEPEYDDINWAYKFPNGFDESIFSSGISIAPTIESLNYPTDWTEETAQYLDENLNTLINAALKLAGVEGTLSDMLKSKINIFTGANLNKLVTLLTDLLGELDAEIVNAAGKLIGADLDALRAYKVDDEATFTTVEFAKELAKILGVIPEVTDLVFFEGDFTLFNKADGSAAVTIKGGRGYAKGLAPILEALGCKDLPAEKGATVEAVLVALANRFDEILADPVNEILNVLPNIIYFINANGIGTSVKNLLACVTGVTDKLSETFGVEVDLFGIINNAIGGLLPEDSQATIDVRNLDLATVFTLVEEILGLDLSAASDILVNFCVGKINPYTSVSGDYGFKMEYNDVYARYDMITILVTVALMLVENEQNAKALDEMIGTDIMSALKTVFGASEIKYTAPNWNYPLAANGTVDAMKYSITYPNNWTEATAQYVTEKLPEIGDMIAGMVDSNYTSLADLLQDKVNVFTAETLNSLVALITDLLGDIDNGLIEAAGLLLNVDIVGLKEYKAPETVDTTAEFAAELANVLNTYAKGVVEWLLLGRDYTFFVDETKMIEGLPYAENEADGKAIITITGAQGYAEGLALLLEALGCKNLPDAYAEGMTTEKIVEGTLASLAARIDAILADPVIEVLALLPNLLYFLNTNGVAAVVDNLTAALTALLDKLSAFGLEVDLNELVNIQSLMGIEGKGATINLDNLTLADLLQAVSLMTGLDLTLIEDVLVGFALGKVEAYDSVSKECGETKKMFYADEFDTYDMITVLANLVIITIGDENNAEFIKDLAGEEIYGVICALLNMEEAPVQDFKWQFTDKADTGYVFSAISASDFYGGEVYGDIYKEEMAQYIADNFGEFVDNIIYLLGINIEGQSVDNLKDLLNGLVNGSLYNSENVVAIRDALAGVLAGVAGLEVNGANVGQYISAVLKNAGIADLDAVATVEVAEFTENREMFVAALCDVLEPLYGILKYVLADEDFSFFVNLDKTNAITLKGAEGYAYGIIPLLETLGCEGILTPAEYYAAIEADGDVLLTSILTPLLDRVDVILSNPADEILGMLPNLIYFINSNGVDTVVKNTLNAVYTLLNAIEPIAKIDLYELIGLDLSTLTFEQLFNMLLEMIAESTGYEFTTLDASAIVELSVGTLESYTSKNGKTAYRMVYTSADEVEGGKTEMVTVVERLLLTFIMHKNNQEMLVGLLKDSLGMTADGEKYLKALLKLIADCTLDTKLGMETALATLYYIYYGLDIGVGESANGMKDLNAEWTKLLADMRNSKDKGEVLAGELIAGILDIGIFDDIIDPEEGIAPNGFIAFFQRIIEFFQKIADWFRNLFN